MTGFFSLDFELLISPNVALFMMLLVSNGFFAAEGCFEVVPARPKESIDPIRFCRALSANVPPVAPPPTEVGAFDPAKRPSELMFPIVK